jgi:hypothetical protein
MIRWMMIAAAVLLLRDEKGDLLAAARKTADAKSYAYRGELKLVLPEGIDKAGGETQKFEGKHERDAGAWAKTDAYEFAMAGGKTASRPVGEWKLVKDDDVQRLLYQALNGSRPPRPPHEEFAAWPRHAVAVKKAEGVYEIEFATEFARELVATLFPMGRWMDRIPIERPAATAKVWINDGRIIKIETVAKVGASIQGVATQLTATRTVSISDYDSAKVQIPEDVKRLLEAK